MITQIEIFIRVMNYNCITLSGTKAILKLFYFTPQSCKQKNKFIKARIVSLENQKVIHE